MAAMNLSFPDTLKIVATTLASIGGGGFLVMTMSGWLGKVWAQRLMQKDIAKHETDLEALKSRLEGINKRIQSELDKTIFVHRTQFETEFKALSEIWGKVVAVRSTLAGLRPQVEITPNQQDNELIRKENFDRKFDRFVTLSGDLRMAAHNQSPFYAQNIYKELIRLIDMLNDEEIAIKLLEAQPFTGGWYKEGKKNWDIVRLQADRISEMIRERIQALSLYHE